MPCSTTGIEECSAPRLGEDREEFVEAPTSRNRASRGAIAGVLLGGCVWAVILVAFGVIKI